MGIDYGRGGWTGASPQPVNLRSPTVRSGFLTLQRDPRLAHAEKPPFAEQAATELTNGLHSSSITSSARAPYWMSRSPSLSPSLA